MSHTDNPSLPATQSEHIKCQFNQSVLSIEIHRPDKKNALTEAMYTDLVNAMTFASDTPSCKACLIHGQAQCFTSGNDVQDFLQHPPKDEQSPVIQFLLALVAFDKPLIAAPSGMAVGIGTTLLLHCDYIIAGNGTKFQMPFVNLGLCPEGGSTLLLPQRVGVTKAQQWLMLGSVFDSQEALSAGLIHQVCDADEINKQGLAICQQFAKQPPKSMRLAKSLLKDRQRTVLRACIMEEVKHFGEQLQSPEAKEAFTAFLEKRQPDFSKFE